MGWFRRHRAIWASVIVVLVLAGAGALAYFKFYKQDDSDSVAAPPAAAPAVAGFRADIKNLPGLSAGHYDAWIISGTTQTLLGKFNIQTDGSLVDTDGKVLNNNLLPFQGNLIEGDVIEVTIEAAQSKDDQPSAAVVLHGALKADGTATLAFDTVNLVSATAKYSLATPTDDPDKNETSGLWFGLPGTKPTPLLSFAPAPSGWKYQGWIMYKDKGLSVGKFSDPRAGDDFNGYSANKKPAPNLPGQDFLSNVPADIGFTFPINLAEGSAKAIITLEPDVGTTDPSGNDAFIILFTSDIPSALKDHVATDMVRAEALPSATFTYSQ